MATEEELFASAFSSDEKPTDAEGQGADAGQGADIAHAAEAAEGAHEGDDGAEGEGQEGQQRTRRGRVPIDELLEERGKRQAAETKLEMTSQQIADLRRELDELRRAPRQAEKQQAEEGPSFWDDPDRVLSQREAQLRREFEQREIGRDLRAAHRQYGDEFKKAFEYVTDRLPYDDSLRVRLMKSADHGEEIMAIYNREKTLQEVGDPTEYRTKLRGELLKDPEFLKEAIESLKAMAGGQPSDDGRPNATVQLPPNLSKAPGSSGRDRLPNGDAELFAQTFGELRS